MPLIALWQASAGGLQMPLVINKTSDLKYISQFVPGEKYFALFELSGWWAEHTIGAVSFQVDNPVHGWANDKPDAEWKVPLGAWRTGETMESAGHF